jgi:hypothetical protein
VGPPEGCVEWIAGQCDASVGFTRWAGYPVADVWAGFCAVGALTAAGETPGDIADVVVATLARMTCPEGGFTYREHERAADALRVAALALTAREGDPALPSMRRWLEGCQLPNEGGLMYMPGRGAEVRCTLWGLAAGACRDDPPARQAIREWLVELQNPDGGFGYWHGRGSDLVSTASAVEAWRLLGGQAGPQVNHDGLAAFIRECDKSMQAGGFAYSNVPGAAPDLRSGLHAARVLAHLGRRDVRGVTDLLERHRVRGGGWANRGSRLPDLLSTYEAVVTADRFGIPVDRGGLDAFLARTVTDGWATWSPMAPAGDALADCLHQLLRERLDVPSRGLPALSLS